MAAIVIDLHVAKDALGFRRLEGVLEVPGWLPAHIRRPIWQHSRVQQPQDLRGPNISIGGMAVQSRAKWSSVAMQNQTSRRGNRKSCHGRGVLQRLKTP